MKIPNHSFLYTKAMVCCTVFLCLMFSETLLAQDGKLTAEDLKNLSLEELMNVEVTSVSKRAEKLRETASAIQIITQKDIHNSGVKTLPEALRLAPNLQVAQVNSSQWAISTRGFNNVLANKLLVMIDGRSVYTPLYAGVFWDIQNVLLEDVDRIEVISGPGGTLWGANAVNGVINIITKSAKNTKGLLVDAVTGSTMPGLGSLRYGGQVNKDITYRIYGTGFKMDNTIVSKTLVDAKDDWDDLQGGLRLDWTPSERSIFSLQQNIYKANLNPNGGTVKGEATGDNILGRWNYKSSDKYEQQLQVYYDNTKRVYPTGLVEDLKTYDFDWHSQLTSVKKHIFSFGSNLRLMNHEVENLPSTQFNPSKKKLYLYSVFLQDQVSFLNNQLKFTFGSKIEHNSYTGFEFQPNVRLAFNTSHHHTIWAAVSRAVKTPSRLDRDIEVYSNPTTLFLTGSDNFRSETLIAYEAGWRSQPLDHISMSLSAFYNKYNYIRSAQPPTPPATSPVTLANGVEGHSYGAELAVAYQFADWWNMKAGYTFFKKDLNVKTGQKDLNNASAESNDPSHQALLQSNLKLPARFELGTVIRYVGKLPKPYVRDYTVLDLRLGWHLNKAIELNIVGQNLLEKQHPEFIPSSPSARQIERSIYGRITFKY